jgi:hypothetical protein
MSERELPKVREDGCSSKPGEKSEGEETGDVGRECDLKGGSSEAYS